MWFKNTKTTFDGVYKTYKKTAGAKSQIDTSNASLMLVSDGASEDACTSWDASEDACTSWEDACTSWVRSCLCQMVQARTLAPVGLLYCKVAYIEMQ
jgi:hypothetical protein